LHFYTLLDGLMAIGHSPVLELPANVVHKVFRALEFGLLGDEVLYAPLLKRPAAVGVPAV
jgi:non-canonical (house-cleaning) NTP pyrophosphatase